MNCFALVNSGLEPLAQREIKELLDINATSFALGIEFSISQKEDFLALLQQMQSARRICVSLGIFSDVESIHLSDFPWKEFFTNTTSFKVEVENLKGQENRFALAKVVAGVIFAALEKENIIPLLDLKKPELLVVVFHSEGQYHLGVDLLGKELNSRAYRVFPHQSSFKGDLAYYFVRASRFQPHEKILIGFCKDGSIAIETALFQHHLSLRKNMNLTKIPWFADISALSSTQPQLLPPIFAFDESFPNITAARKNTSLAGVKQFLNIQKYALDEVDVKYDQHSFDRAIFHITNKDEDKINEIYYQTQYILKSKGTLLLIGRKNWEVFLSSKFRLIESAEFLRGDSALRWWLLEKK